MRKTRFRPTRRNAPRRKQALERFFQLADAEVRADLLRKSLPILDDLIARARSAKVADVRFPLELGELERQRSQLESQLEQAELASRLLNVDLKRRLGFPDRPNADRLWPEGFFGIDPTPLDPEAAVNAALADRPELRGLRDLYRQLTPETLPDARDFLRASNPLLGGGASGSEPRLPWLLSCWLKLSSKSKEAKAAEVEVRKKQLLDILAYRERAVADETRAAVLTANSQRVKASLARDRVRSWEEKLADAEKKRAAGQAGAEFLVPQVQSELQKARSELAAEVAAWHQGRIRVKAAQGWLVWETISKDSGP
jgi:hypothetical protein